MPPKVTVVTPMTIFQISTTDLDPDPDPCRDGVTQAA